MKSKLKLIMPAPHPLWRSVLTNYFGMDYVDDDISVSICVPFSLLSNLLTTG